MYCTKTMPLLLVLLLCSLTFHVATAADPLNNFCFSQENYPNDSTYSKNLKDLLRLLTNKAPSTGFGLGSIGKSQNYVSGLALCRADVSSRDCGACIKDASKEILQRCPNKKGAIIWYDYCLLKYSNLKFFGKIDNYNKFYMCNLKDVDGDPDEFNEKVNELLGGLANKAKATRKLYATGELGLQSHEKLYGLVQCTRDLSSAACKKCLDDAISELPGWCSGKRGGRTVGGSCNVRYELYPIINT